MTRKILIIFIFFLEILLPSQSRASSRDINFDRNWRFELGNNTQASSLNFIDTSWRSLNLPHDWAIEGVFNENNPSGVNSGALPGGIGWYRKTFDYQTNWNKKKIFIDFDGVYMNSEVWINGHSLGVRPYGYSSFRYDLTPYLNKHKNVIAVKVDNTKQPNSRWYSGCGIYRNVWLVVNSPIHITHWGVHVTSTLNDKRDGAEVNVAITIQNEGITSTQATLFTKIIDADNHMVASAATATSAWQREQTKTKQIKMQLTQPHLWSPDKPYLYRIITQLRQQKRILQSDTTTLGVRAIEFTDKKGFFLNGQPLKMKGVCLHHDAGCLGAVVNRRAIQRQLEILRQMGCNAIRCSHNPPAPELLDLCDEMGFMVMDETFDMWRKRKTTYDYSKYFEKLYKRDLTDCVLRDRNHPCIMMWSIGNEVLEQWTDVKADTLNLNEANLLLNFKKDSSMLNHNGDSLSVNSLLTIRLANIVKNLDNRPVTAACNEPSPNNNLFRSGALDLIGFNYHNDDFSTVGRNFPNKPFFISESTSALQTRGYYRMPSDSMYIWPKRWDIPFNDPSYSCSAYDNCHAPWGTTHERSLIDFMKNDYIFGMFVWTGFDYIGEPTPYQWPARSSYFGIVDLAGFPKDIYYLYQSVWTDKPMLHIFPHWNWEANQTVDIWAYYNDADEVELYLNGISQGIRRKKGDAMHVMWRLMYQPGTLHAISRKNGKIVKEETVRTAGKATRISLTADRKVIQADGNDLCYVTVDVTDKDGILCPWAENQITFTVSGSAKIVGVDNGSPISLEPFKANQRKAFYGKCLVVLQNNGVKGNVILKAIAPQLQDASIAIICK